jgi:hypothetical protein
MPGGTHFSVAGLAVYFELVGWEGATRNLPEKPNLECCPPVPSQRPVSGERIFASKLSSTGLTMAND